MTRRSAIGLAAAAAVILQAPAASALPTMIRLGYATCTACHLAPQGGGPLTPYGRSIDQGQSLRAGDYRPKDNKVVRAISWDGRIAQDLRLVLPMQRAWAAHEPSRGSFRPRLQYRNFTELPRGVAVHVTFTAETDPIPGASSSYDPAPDRASPVLNVAMVHYRVRPGLDLGGGRDQLPSGVNVADLGAFTKDRNNLGYYDTPAQFKVDWSGKRHRVVPFVYAPGGNEADGRRESGAGAVAEFDPIGAQHTVIGATFQQGHAADGDRRLAGAHARLGFGPWGILAEHTVTDRDPADGTASFRQHATYGQLFWAVREWLVASAIGERLSVRAPFVERINDGRLELAARFTAMATVAVTARVQRDEVTGRTTKSLTLQVALKTVY